MTNIIFLIIFKLTVFRSEEVSVGEVTGSLVIEDPHTTARNIQNSERKCKLTKEGYSVTKKKN